MPYTNRQYQAMWEQDEVVPCSGCVQLLGDRRDIYEKNTELRALLKQALSRVEELTVEVALGRVDVASISATSGPPERT